MQELERILNDTIPDPERRRSQGRRSAAEVAQPVPHRAPDEVAGLIAGDHPDEAHPRGPRTDQDVSHTSLPARAAGWSFREPAGDKRDGAALETADDLHVVGGDEHRGSKVGDLLEQVGYLPGRLLVEVPRRFVGDQDRGLADDGAGDGDALLLAAGELQRIHVGLVMKMDGVEGVERTLGSDTPGWPHPDTLKWPHLRGVNDGWARVSRRTSFDGWRAARARVRTLAVGGQRRRSWCLSSMS